MAEEKEARAWRGHEELYNQFCAKVLGLTETDKWRDWLDFQRKFYRYSSSNAMLIGMQYPHANFVGSRKFWQNREREVTPEGLAHPIRIWCPIEKTLTQATLNSNAVAQTAALDDESESPKRHVVGWIMGKVYDAGQTDGKALPLVADPLEGQEPEGLFVLLSQQAETLGFTVEVVAKEKLGAANGDCSHSLKRIRIREDLSPAHRCKTAAHELAHAMMHEKVEGYRADAGLQELEAESVAYLVCGSRGLQTDDYSLGYVASWASGGGRISNQPLLKRLKGQARRVQSASAQIIKALEQEITIPALELEASEINVSL
jgi:hypothetical protein